MATRVFISYSHLDVKVANNFHDSLTAKGFSCWRDERYLLPGDDFSLEITRAIRDCEAFLLLMSPASMASDYVAKETAIADHFGKPIFPVVVKAAEMSDRLLPYLVCTHACDLSEGGLAGLDESLRRVVAPSVRVAQKKSRPRGSPARSLPLVTGGQYRAFLDACPPRRRPPRGASPAAPNVGADDLPVTGVSWDEAVAYCDWVGGRLAAPGDHVAVEGGRGGTRAAKPIYEWRDAGSEKHKQVGDLDGSAVIAVMDRKTRRDDVGFRSIEARSSAPERWVRIEGGRWRLGADPAAFAAVSGTYHLHSTLVEPVLARSARECPLSAYAISATPVTNEEYFTFARETGRAWPAHWDSLYLDRFQAPYGRRVAVQPVVNVTAEDAQAYCIWSRTRLPTWMEWERAASGPERRPYPWGSTYGADVCNSIESERGAVADVDDFATGDSAEGARQMCGNVAEWVLGPRDRMETRGGSYQMTCEVWGFAYAFRLDFQKRAPDIGFRVVRDAGKP